jgi:hypothetical protein
MGLRLLVYFYAAMIVINIRWFTKIGFDLS